MTAPLRTLPPALLLSEGGQVLNVAAGYLRLSAEPPERRALTGLREYAHLPHSAPPVPAALPLLTAHRAGQLTVLTHVRAVLSAETAECLHVPEPLLELMRLPTEQLGALTNPRTAAFSHLVTLHVQHGAFSGAYWLRTLSGPRDLAWLSGPLNRGEVHLARPERDLGGQLAGAPEPVTLDFTRGAWQLHLTFTPRAHLPLIPAPGAS